MKRIILFSLSLFLIVGEAMVPTVAAQPAAGSNNNPPKTNADSPQITWEEFDNPSAFDMQGLVVLGPDDIFSFTQNTILHFDGTKWSRIFSTLDCQIWAIGTDGRFLVAAMDTLNEGLYQKPKVFVFQVQRQQKKVWLGPAQIFRVPLSHTPNSVLFLRPGVALISTILEYAVLRLSFSVLNSHVNAKIEPKVLHLTSDIGSFFLTKSIDGKNIIFRIPKAVIYTSSYNFSGLSTPEINDWKFFINKRTLVSTGYPKIKGKFQSLDIHPVSVLDSSFYAAIVSQSYLLIFNSRQQPPLQLSKKIWVHNQGKIPVLDMQALTVAQNRRIYTMTKNGRLLQGRFFPKKRPQWRWDILAQIPVAKVWSILPQDHHTLLIWGSNFIRVHLPDDAGELKAEKRPAHLPPNPNAKIRTKTNKSLLTERKTTKTNLFSVLPPFDAGTTYGVGIGQLDKTRKTYLYLVDVYNKNRLFLRNDQSSLEEFGTVTADLAEKRGLSGRVTAKSRPDRDMSLAVNIGDVNEDGANDIVLSYLDSTDALYLNNGNGYFRDVSRAYNLTQPIGRSECVLLADVNNDGYLDLFTTSSVSSNRLFLNQKGARFKEATLSSGLATSGLGITAAFGDANGDGYEDLYVGNWDAENRFYINNGDGTFRDATEASGLRFGALHKTNSALWADFNNDGALDLFVGNRGVGNRLFLNDGQAHFRDVTRQAGVTDHAIVYGSVFGDFDNDGWLDLFLAAGGEVLFYRNTGTDENGIPHFIDATDQAAPPMLYYRGYNTGLATWDAERDGDLDVLMGQFQGRSVLFRNIVNSPLSVLLQKEKVTPAPPNYLAVSVAGVRSNRDGIGAKLWLYRNNRLIGYREVASGYGYASSSSRIQHFGLPPTSESKTPPQYRLAVEFPATGIRKEQAVLPGQWVHIREIDGFAATKIYWEKAVFRVLSNLSLFADMSFSRRLLELLSLFLLLSALLIGFSYRVRRQGYDLRAYERRQVIGFAVGIYFILLFLLFIQKKLFMNPSEWVAGKGNVYLNHWVPLLAAIGGAAAFLKIKRRELSLRSMKSEIHERLYQQLKNFRHGEGGNQNLNRLALFAENIHQLFPLEAGSPPARKLQENKTGHSQEIRIKRMLEACWRGLRPPFWRRLPPATTVAALSNAPALARFQLALAEYRDKTFPELKRIVGLYQIVVEENDFERLTKGPRSGAERNRIPAPLVINSTGKIPPDIIGQSLSKTATQLMSTVSQLIRLADPHEEKMRTRTNISGLQSQLCAQVRKLQVILTDLRKMFDQNFVTNVSSVLELIQQKFSRARGRKKLSLVQIKIEDRSPNIRAVIGQSDLMDVLNILIQNSIEAAAMASPPKSAKTKIRIRSAQIDHRLQISVEDNGPGVPENCQRRLFKPGFTVKKGEHGYGLYQAQTVLTKYGGKIYYDGSFTNGARFVFDLEVAR